MFLKVQSIFIKILIKQKIRQNVWAFADEHAGVRRKDVWCKEMGWGERSVEDKGNVNKSNEN